MDPSHDEQLRLQTLADYGVMDTAPDEILDRLVALASQICEAPVSLVSLVDATRQWFKAKVGLDATETPREYAFCAHAIAQPTARLFTVTDARIDPRFETNPLVTGAPDVVFYAGVPLVVEGGAKLGTLCVIDRVPRELSPVQERALAMLGELVVKRLEEVRARELDQARRLRFEAALTGIDDAVVTVDAAGAITFANPAAARLTGWRADELRGGRHEQALRFLDARSRAAVASAAGTVLARGTAATLDHLLLVRRDGGEVAVDLSASPIRNATGRLVGAVITLRDRTEARAREAADAAARIRLEKMFEHAPAFVAILRGPTHVFELANRAYQALVGAGRPLLGHTVAEALPEVVSQGFIELLDRVYRSGERYVGSEVQIFLSRDGVATERRFVNFVYQPWREAGAIAGVDVFGFEVTSEVEAREQMFEQQLVIKEREARLRQVIEAAGAGTWDLDAATMEIASNPRMTELMGLPPGTAFSLASGLLQVPEPDRQLVSDAVARSLAGEHGGAYRMEFRTGGANGVPERWVESRAQADFDAAGQATHLAGVMIEVTNRKQLEVERANASARVTHMLETMSDGFLAIDAGWRLTVANATFERISGIRREDAIGRLFWELFPEVAAERGHTWTNYNRSMNERVSVAFQSYSPGRDAWTDQRANPTEDGGIAVFFHDITPAKRIEQALEQQAAFERQLIGIVSHDLRNPLGVVEMATALLDEQPELAPASRKFVNRARVAARRATDLIRDLLDFTQARVGGGIRLERAPADLNAIARDVIDELETTHPGRTIRFHDDGDGRGHWDGARLGQVVQNLVSNALKYSAPGSAIEVATRGGPDEVTLVVRNDGTPIPEAKLASVFEPFERGANTDASTRSVGLGLYIVRQIVTAHGGRIAVQSTQATGTSFTVALPRG